MLKALDPFRFVLLAVAVWMVLFFIDLSTGKVEIAGMAPVVNGLWIS